MITEAAARLRIGRSTAYELIASGHLEGWPLVVIPCRPGRLSAAVQGLGICGFPIGSPTTNFSLA